MADFYDTNDAHQKLGRRIAETLLWEVYDRMISMYSLTPEERYLEIINRCPDLLKLIFPTLTFAGKQSILYFMKKIIIIGATSGIGRGLAEVYSQEDYLIGITGRRENLLEEVCARDKDKLFYQVCDITDTQATISSLKTLTQK